MNVIAVDWSGGNRFPYNQAVANTVVAATAIRQLLEAIINKGVQPQNIHLIGHSLGAHISSYVGRDLPNLGRISGLGIFHSEKYCHFFVFNSLPDPAGPDFYVSDIPDRLDASDALFVDVIHTDGAPRMVSGFGYLDALGHVDFYPNGGSAQPSKLRNIKIINKNHRCLL
jgi:pimeloyl-ACP methyl ester carboxylesterase